MFKIKVDSKLYKILVFLASIDMGYGPVKDVVIAHGLHHIHSDKGPEDNMNWRYHWYSTTIVSPIPRLNDVKPKNYEEYLQKQTHKHHNIWSDPWTDFCSRHHVKISFLTCLVLAVLCPVILLKVICLGRFLLTVMTGIAGSVGHMDFFPGSYRNFKTNDTSSNSIVFHYLFLGLYTGMLQNNHHANPASIKPNPRWWEIDTSYPFVLALKHFIEKK